MASLNRFVIDLTTDEELSERRIQSIAKELSDHVHLFSEDEDGVDQKSDKLFYGHVHNAAEDICRYCRSHSRDGVDGESQHS